MIARAQLLGRYHRGDCHVDRVTRRLAFEDRREGGDGFCHRLLLILFGLTCVVIGHVLLAPLLFLLPLPDVLRSFLRRSAASRIVAAAGAARPCHIPRLPLVVRASVFLYFGDV